MEAGMKTNMGLTQRGAGSAVELGDIRTVTNVGAGTMGHAIALQFALAGYATRLCRKPSKTTRRSDHGIGCSGQMPMLGGWTVLRATCIS